MKLQRLPCYCAFFFFSLSGMLHVTKVVAQGNDRVSAGEIQVTGTIKDRLNQPLVNVSIYNKTTGKSMVTDSKGTFSISAHKGDSLFASMVGYVIQGFAVNDLIVFNLTLEAQSGSMNDVVVVGYGQQKKISLVGAQSSVNVEDLKQPIANLSATLAGRISGLVGVQRTGLPGSNSADIWIRGISTFNGSNDASPLIIVDGVQGRDLNAFDPEDIASFSILKDASATAVYGAQGANGVILITTKKGRAGKVNLMANYNQGFVSFTKTPKLANAEQYMTLRNEAESASGISPEYSQAYIDTTLAGNQPYLYPNVDWMDVLFKDAASNRRVNFSARGGSENVQFYTSLAYYDETSLLRTDELQRYKADTRFRRYNFTSNVDMNWTKTTKFSLGIQGYITNTDYPGTNPQDIFGRVMQTNPVLYPKMYEGNLLPAVNSSTDAQPNPYGLATQTGYQNIFSSQIYTNANLNQDLGFWVKGLSFHGLFSFDTYNSHTINRTRQRSTYLIERTDPYSEDGSLNLVILTNGSDALSYSRSNNGTRQFYAETGINYDRSFGGHHVTGMVLYNQNSETEAFASDVTSSLPYRKQGIAGRGTYSWQDKYFGEFDFGYNGSENFASNNRYGFFPSLGVGWVLSNEDFFKPLTSIFQFFKIRYSNGYVGAAGGGRRFGYRTIVSDDANGITFGNGTNNISYSGVAISDYGVDVRWAKSHKQDLGWEFKMLDSRLNVTLDYFKEHRTDVFLQRGTLPAYVGLQNSPWGNLGIINNEGFDGTVELNAIQWGPTSWSFRGTFSYNKDKVIENDQAPQPYPYMDSRGYNYLSTFGYIASGLFQSQNEIDNSPDQSAVGSQRVGDIKYKDLNGDGRIDVNDRTRIGNGDIPNWTYGFGFNVTFKSFYVGAFFQGIEGAQRLISGDGIIPFNNGSGPERSNLFAIAEDRWTEENHAENPFYPRLGYGTAVNANNSVASTWWIKNIDFLRLKTVDLGYYLPSSAFHNIGLKNTRVYLQGVNLLYWSKFKLWDPELNTANGTSYPNTRTISIGLQANF